MTGKLYSELVRGRRSVRTFDGKGISDPGIPAPEQTEYIASFKL